MTPDRQVIKSQRRDERVRPIQIRLRHSLVRGRRIGLIDRSIDRSDPRPNDPPPPIASPKRGPRNHRHLLSVLSSTDNLLARSTRSTIISRLSVCRQRISTEGTGQPRKTVRDIYSPGGYPRIVSARRGEVLALLGQLRDPIDRAVPYRRQAFREKRTDRPFAPILSFRLSTVP